MARADDFRAYYATKAGRLTANRLARLIAPSIRRGTTHRFLAAGYPRPLLFGLSPALFERVVMLATEGAPIEKWPRRGTGNNAVSGAAGDLPFPGALFDQMLAIHCLEHGDARAILEEWHRVLAPGGELVLVVPNRSGIWSSFESTPFGSGHPYGRGELARLLADHDFTIVSARTALAAPPVRWLGWTEWVLGKILPRLGGVHLVLARKGGGPAPKPVGRVVHARQPGPVPAGQVAARAMPSRRR